MVKIYTKTGDKGKTGLMGGKRVLKDDLRIVACGEIDELNALIGVCRTLKPSVEIDKILMRLQNELFCLGADIATPDKNIKVPRIQKKRIHLLEKNIDVIDGKLDPLKHFILPGGSEAGANLHLARTVCRRAERSIVKLHSVESLDENILAYINRLSDLLFMLARFANKNAGIAEEKWKV